MVLNPGEQFAGYTIESVLGTGGMGAVYLAKHPRLPRRDALKLLNPAFSNDPNFRARFEREADLAAGLVHRNIVAVYDRGSVDGQLWISMQYVAGVDASVAARAGDGSMTPHRVVHIISEVGAGLDYAHRAGLLHRDVKPANILLAAPDDPSEPEHVLLTDFGIAKSTDEVQHLTGTGNLLATLAYASPEQIEAKKLDHRVDIYALGCVLFELLTGNVPYPEPSPFATMTAHLKNPVPKVTERVPWLPPGLDAVVAKALAKNPDDRYNSCRELSLAARAALVAADPALSTPTRAEVAVQAERAPNPELTSVDVAVPAVAAAAVAAVEEKSLTTPRPPYTVGVRRTNRAQGTVAELGPINTSALPAPDRIEMERLLLEEVHFFELPPRLRLLEVVPGDVVQEITVANSEVTRTVLYEREGSRHPKGLDDLVALLERHTGWQVRQLTTGPQHLPPGWTPTGSVPPLGAAAVRPTEIRPQNPTGYRPSGPTAMMPPIGPPPGAAHPSGPHQAYQTGPVQPGPAPGPAKSAAKMWTLIGVAAAVVVAVGVVLFFLLRTPPPGIQPPENLAANANAQRDITVSWSQSSGATGYTVTRNGDTVYSGPNTSWTDSRALPGKYNYTVTATSFDGQTSTAAGPQAVTIPDKGWGALTNVASDFEDLVPASPSEKGYEGATCTAASDNFGSNADGIVTCTDQQGVTFWVMHFPSEQARDDYIGDSYGDSPEQITWTRGDEDAGMRYGSAADESSLPYLLTTFYDPEYVDYVVVVEWQGHTTQQLIDSWWKPAPF